MKYSILLLSLILSVNVFAGRAASKYQAVESCKYTTPKCTTTSNGAATTINTTCNGSSINNYSDTALKYRATANGDELYVEWTQNGTGASKSELISFNDIQVNSCSSQDSLKEAGIQVCQGVSPATTGVNDYLGCGSNYFVTRSAADLNKLILTYNPYGSDVNSGNDYKEWKYVTPSQLNIPVYNKPEPVKETGNFEDAAIACLFEFTNEAKACNAGIYATNRIRACGHGSNNLYSIKMLNDGSIELSGIESKYLKNTVIKTGTTLHSFFNIPNCKIDTPPVIVPAVAPTRSDAISACANTNINCKGNNTVSCSNADFKITRNNDYNNILDVKYNVDSSNINSAFNGTTWNIANTELNVATCVAPPTKKQHYQKAKIACAGVSVGCGFTTKTTASCGGTYSVIRDTFVMGGDNKYQFKWTDETGAEVKVDVENNDFIPSNANACSTQIKQACSTPASIKSCSATDKSQSCNYGYTIKRDGFNPAGIGSGGNIYITKDDGSLIMPLTLAETGASACYSENNYRDKAISQFSNSGLSCSSADYSNFVSASDGFTYGIKRTAFDEYSGIGGIITLSVKDSSGNQLWSGDVASGVIGANACVKLDQEARYSEAKTACAGAAVACGLATAQETTCSDARYKVVRSPFSMGENQFLFTWEDGTDTVAVEVNAGDFTPSNTTACNTVIKQVCSGAGGVKSCSNDASSQSCGYGYTINRNAYNPVGSGSGGDIFITSANDSSFNLAISREDAGAFVCHSFDDHKNTAETYFKANPVACLGEDKTYTHLASNGFNYELKRTAFDKYSNTGGDISISASNLIFGKVWEVDNVDASSIDAVACVGFSETDFYNTAKTKCAGAEVSCSLNSSEETSCGSEDGVEYFVSRGAFKDSEDNFTFRAVYNSVEKLNKTVESGDFTPSNANACNGVIKTLCVAKTGINECSTNATSESCGYHGYKINRLAFVSAGDGSGGDIFISKDSDTSFNMAIDREDTSATACYSDNYHRNNAISKAQALTLACGSSSVDVMSGNDGGDFTYHIKRTGFDKFLNTGGDINIYAKKANDVVWSSDVGASTVNADSCVGYSTADLYSMAKTKCGGKSTSCALNTDSSTSCGTQEGATFSVVRGAFANGEGGFKFTVEYQDNLLLDTSVVGNDYTDVNPTACNPVIKTACGNNASSVNTCSNSAMSDSCGYFGYQLQRTAFNPAANNNDGSGGELSITKNGILFLNVSANDVGINECKSNNEYLSSHTCSGDAENYCTSGGFSNKSCDNSYYLTRTGYDMNNETGGALSIKLPNSHIMNVDIGDVNAPECISANRHQNNAITLCSTRSSSFGESTCSQFGRSEVSCGSTDGFNYTADRTAFNTITGAGGRVNLYGKYGYTGIWQKDINSVDIGAHTCAIEVPPVEENKDSTDVDVEAKVNRLEDAF
jgi:hypothetical protein